MNFDGMRTAIGIILITGAFLAHEECGPAHEFPSISPEHDSGVLIKDAGSADSTVDVLTDPTPLEDCSPYELCFEMYAVGDCSSVPFECWPPPDNNPWEQIGPPIPGRAHSFQ